MMSGNIFDVKHFAVHDGPGIRTTVFFKGCPLKCIWCHNPESISGKKQLGFLSHKCVRCGKCVTVCPQGAHYIDENGQHKFDRNKCVACGTCVSACYAKALTLYGKQVDVESLVAELLEDKDFYDSSNGGVTLSGGECLMQAEFCTELLHRLKEQGIHTAVDTCGFVPRETLDKVIPFTDVFLYDMKAVDEEVHLTCTARPNGVILENLRYLDEKGCKIEIRIPFVPGWNHGQIEKMAEVLSGLTNVVGVRVLPYHNYAGTKYRSLDMKDTLPEQIPTDEELKQAKDILREYGMTVLD